MSENPVRIIDRRDAYRERARRSGAYLRLDYIGRAYLGTAIQVGTKFVDALRKYRDSHLETQRRLRALLERTP